MADIMIDNWTLQRAAIIIKYLLGSFPFSSSIC